MTTPSPRLDYLDATRAFALVLGILFHAGLSFLPMFLGWAVQDVSTSLIVAAFVMISHAFRMEVFFLLAGFFGCLTLQRKSTADFLRSRAVRIVVPFVVGWFLLRPLLVSGWIMGSASLRGDYDFWAGLAAGVASLKTLPAGIFTGSHLWFLYYLALITALALAARALLAATGSFGQALTRGADAGVRWLARSPLALPALAVPTAATLWFMSTWGMDTPDRTLTPHVPVLLVYGGFFTLGWLLGRQPDAIAPFTRLSVFRWIAAIAGAVACWMLGGLQMQTAHPYHTAAHIAHVAAYALMMWSLVCLTIGLFRKFCARPRAWIRYVADSSYWMYLIHLPIVVWLQVAVAELPFHWSLKLAGISLATVAIALLTYDLFVRSTFIGAILNGRRRERALSGLFFASASLPESQETKI